jgi:hypothetical protein
MPVGPGNPVTSEASTIAPELEYSPIVPALSATKRFDPDIAI